PPAVSPNAERLFLQALEHFFGPGKKVNLPEATRLFQQAADEGHVLGTAYLGLLYMWGNDGVHTDVEKARQFCLSVVPHVKDMAAKGNLHALYALACFHVHGLGVDKDEKEGFRLFLKGAEKEHAPSQFSVGARYMTGEGIEKDYDRA